MQNQLVCVNVEHDLLPLLLAYCNYSLQQGKGTQVDYDLRGLQDQIYQRFIRGKHRITTEVNHQGYNVYVREREKCCNYM